MISRRGLLIGGAATLISAPAIVRPGVLMPIKPKLVPAPDIIRKYFVLVRDEKHWQEMQDWLRYTLSFEPVTP